MEEEHHVPKLKVQALVTLPLVGFPIPQRLAYALGGSLMLFIFLLGQGLDVYLLLFLVALSTLAGLACYVVKPEGIPLSRWAVILWRYVQLPRNAVWQVGAAGQVQDLSRAGGAEPTELFGGDYRG